MAGRCAVPHPARVDGGAAAARQGCWAWRGAAERRPRGEAGGRAIARARRAGEGGADAREGQRGAGGAMKVATYLRISTGQQTVENQRIELRRYIEARGFELVREYVDEGISGATTRRRALEQLLAD